MAIYRTGRLGSGPVRAVANVVEAAGRLVVARDNLQSKVGAGPLSLTSGPTLLSGEQQHEIYGLYEGYFQGVYKNLSLLAALSNLNQSVFGSLPTKSMAKFLSAVGKNYPELGPPCEMLEAARKYRTLLDHPASFQVTDWATYNMHDGRGAVVHHYAKCGKSGTVPPEAEPVGTGKYPYDADWVYDSPSVAGVDQAYMALISFFLRKLHEALVEPITEPDGL